MWHQCEQKQYRFMHAECFDVAKQYIHTYNRARGINAIFV